MPSERALHFYWTGLFGLTNERSLFLENPAKLQVKKNAQVRVIAMIGG